VGLVVWAPVVAQNRIPAPAVDAAAVTAARTTPADAVMDEVTGFNLMADPRLDRATTIAVADGIVQGRLALPGQPAAALALPFSPRDLDDLPPSVQLWFAGYGVPAVLLDAYTYTSDERYFNLARDIVGAWDQYERTAWQPRGYLWNDHATAARVRVLGEFWRLYRQRADFDPEVGRVVLEQAARYRSLLAAPGRFTFATNHGMMQNLALLQSAALFPTLPGGAASQQVALERLGRQLSFLVDDQGLFRENSAGYQAFDLRVLAMTFRTMTLLGLPIPDDWARTYESGLATLGRFQRPDGTLPAFGDTSAAEPVIVSEAATVEDGATGPLRPWSAGAPDRAMTLDAAGGTWTDWDGLSDWPDPDRVSQTVATWTSPMSQSHKHADELSVLVWSKGVSWLTSAGYWPLADASRPQAESWSGSNAPHVVGEDAASERSASALASGSGDGLSAVDLERQGPGGYEARRQVVHLEPDTWLIVDHVRSDPGTGNETIWQLPANVTASPGDDPGEYRLEADNGATAALTVLASPGSELRAARGSRDPFAGWEVRQSEPEPAPAITVTQPAGDSWSALVLSTARDAVAGTATIADGSRADAWTVTVPTADGATAVTWSDGTLTTKRVPGAEGVSSQLRLEPVTGAAAGEASFRRAFEDVAAVYPQFQERTSARTKVTLGVGALLGIQLVLLLAVWWRRPALLLPVAAACVALLLVVGGVVSLLVLPGWQVLAPG
jgi:hypothetical protein